MKMKFPLFPVLALLSVFTLSSFAQEPAAAPAETNAVEEVAVTAVEVGENALPDTVEAEKEISIGEQWILYIKQGGTTMIFLGLLSVLGLGCALERFCNLKLSRVVPNGFSMRVITLWRQGNLDEIADLCARNKSMLARVVETMLEHRSSTNYQEIKMFAEDKAGRELRLENRKSSMLSTVATLAPLLGLFGTVVGLLGAFGTVAAMGEMGDASVLADDIGKALVTTVAGLAISMPALFVYNVIKNRLNLYAVILEEEVADMINKIFVEKN